MKRLSKFIFRVTFGCICSLAILCTSIPALAVDTGSLEGESSVLQQQLNGINSELLSMGTEIADIENQIETTNNGIISTEEQLAIIKNSESQQYEAMKQRIKYMYENGESSLLELLFSSDSISDFVNKADFIESVSSYDREQLNELQTTHTTIQEQQASLSDKKESLELMEDELQEKQTTLNQKAAETSTSISELDGQIAKIRAEQQKAAEEKAAQERAAQEAQAAEASSSSGSSSDQSSTVGSPSAPNYSIPGEGLTPEKGVVYFNGHRETYYSQKVLPGTGLNIPGRHVAEDGKIRDIDNYICVASSDLEKGTLVETSLGMGKVYDSGCASGTIDLYTDW